MSVTLINLPQVITEPGTYVTRCGEVVTITRMLGRRFYGATGHYSNGVRETWDVSGRVLPFSLSNNDVVRKTEQSEI